MRKTALFSTILTLSFAAPVFATDAVPAAGVESATAVEPAVETAVPSEPPQSAAEAVRANEAPAPGPAVVTEGTQQTEAAPASQPAPGTAADGTAAAAAAVDDPIVCKKVEQTGTRLKKDKICRKRSEWNKLMENARQYMKDNDRKNSTGPGGETLPTGG